MDHSDVSALAKAALGAMKFIRSRLAGDRQRFNDALGALYEAVTQTEIYVAEARDQERQVEREETLANLWRKASILVGEFDHDLGARCFVKGSFWIDPREWTLEQVQEAGISLRRVSAEAEELLWSR